MRIDRREATASGPLDIGDRRTFGHFIGGIVSIPTVCGNRIERVARC
jgi:hypothetical protein